MFRVNSTGAVECTFVPQVVLRNCRLGETVLRGGLFTQADVRKGLDIRKEPCDRKIGEHLKLSPALTIEGLKAALDRQKSYSTRRIGELLVSEGLVTPQ